MYVSAPIVVRNRIVGAVSVGKPVTSLGQFVDAARRKTLLAGVTAATAALILAMILSLWLVLPQGLVGDYLRQVRRQHAWNLPGLWRHLSEMTATAYRDVRDALEGRSYAADLCADTHARTQEPALGHSRRGRIAAGAHDRGGPQAVPRQHRTRDPAHPGTGRSHDAACGTGIPTPA